MIVVAIIGILAAVAIPAFMKNARKAKTTEATINVKKMADGAVTYFQEEMNGKGSAIPIAKQFPDDAAATIAPALGTCCAALGQKCSANPALWADASWQALKFSMDDPHYYSYEYQRNPAAAPSAAGAPTVSDGKGATQLATEYFYADAFGDLNCDGVYSTFEMFGGVQGDNSITTGAGMFKTAELE